MKGKLMGQPDLEIKMHTENTKGGFTVECKRTECEAGFVVMDVARLIDQPKLSVCMYLQDAAPMIVDGNDENLGEVMLKVWDFAAVPFKSHLLKGWKGTNQDDETMVYFETDTKRFTSLRQYECEMLVATLFAHADGLYLTRDASGAP